jgi:hypothetical protein
MMLLKKKKDLICLFFFFNLIREITYYVEDSQIVKKAVSV